MGVIASSPAEPKMFGPADASVPPGPSRVGDQPDVDDDVFDEVAQDHSIDSARRRREGRPRQCEQGRLQVLREGSRPPVGGVLHRVPRRGRKADQVDELLCSDLTAPPRTTP